MVNHVEFTVEGKKRTTAACFGEYYLKNENHKPVFYHCKPDTLNQEEIDTWLEFCAQILDPSKYEVEKESEFVNFKVAGELFKKGGHSLTYLTFFRMLDEFWYIVRDFCENKGEKTLEEQFLLLQEIHPKFQTGKKMNSGHYPVPFGDYSTYTIGYDIGEWKPTTLESFRAKFAKPFTAVQKLFC